VLQRIQPVVGKLGDILAGGPNAKYSACIAWRPVGWIGIM
jgi:hypothetical protein